jgi:hypothetical protein
MFRPPRPRPRPPPLPRPPRPFPCLGRPSLPPSPLPSTGVPSNPASRVGKGAWYSSAPITSGNTPVFNPATVSSSRVTAACFVRFCCRCSDSARGNPPSAPPSSPPSRSSPSSSVGGKLMSFTLRFFRDGEPPTGPSTSGGACLASSSPRPVSAASPFLAAWREPPFALVFLEGDAGSLGAVSSAWLAPSSTTVGAPRPFPPPARALRTGDMGAEGGSCISCTSSAAGVVPSAGV